MLTAIDATPKVGVCQGRSFPGQRFCLGGRNPFSTVIPAPESIFLPSFRRKPESIFSTVIPAPAGIYFLTVIPAPAGIHFLTVIPAPAGIYFLTVIPAPALFSYRHSGESLFTVIPAKAGIHFLPSFRRKPESIFYRHSGESRNLAPPPYSTLHRSNGFAPQPPEKSAIFSDANPLRSVHKYGTLAISKSGNPAPRGDVPPKAGPAAQVHGDPSDCVSSPKAKASGENRATIKNRVQDNTAKTVGIATIVGSGTHSALFHGGVSGHAAGVPTALCRSIQWAGAWKTRTRNLQAK